MPPARPTLAAGALLWLTGCFYFLAGDVGTREFQPPRRVAPADIALPAGYRIEPVATGLTFPTAVAFDAQGTPHVTEAGYSYGEVFTEPRLLRVEPDGRTSVVARGEHPPWTGVTFHQGAFYLAEGGEIGGGRIVRVEQDGTLTPLVSDLPSMGDHHTNGPAFGPDGALYFGVGTATNSAVVGLDNYKFGWLKRYPDFHDVPCRDVVLAGLDSATPNPFTEDAQDTVSTGAYVPFGTPTQEGQVIPGRMPCNGAILRLAPGARSPELVAWGLRNPYGLGFSPDGRLYVTENGFDVRGSRPIFGAGDFLWRLDEPGQWLGWPDFSGGLPVNKEWRNPPEAGGSVPPRFLLKEHPGPPPQPVARFGVHSSSNRFDFSRGGDFGFEGQAFVAQFGDQSPDTGKLFEPVGFKVVRVDVDTGVIRTFVANKDEKGRGGPASNLGTGGLERPMDARFDPSGRALYIVDFGVMTVTEKEGIRPYPGTGVLWRVTREPSAASEVKP